ncbi:hypothetical protein MBLNU230_g2604t1 [Neophaeotheca triangularis]
MPDEVVDEIGIPVAFHIDEPTGPAPLGLMRISARGRLEPFLRVAIGLDELPSSDVLMQTFGSDVRPLVEIVTVEHIVGLMANVPVHGTDAPAFWVLYGIADLSALLRPLWSEHPADDGYEKLAEALERLPGLRGVSRPQIFAGIRRYVIETARVLGEHNTGAFPESLTLNGNAPGPRPASPRWGDITEAPHEDKEPSQGIKGLLYFIAEHDATQKAYEHRGIHCDSCGEQPIKGIRWHCLNCPNLDYCSTCEATVSHYKTHVFAKIKIPLPVLSQPTKQLDTWYPANRDLGSNPPEYWLDSRIKHVLADELGFEHNQIDALCDQFLCIANVPMEGKALPCGIDKSAFKRALSSERWPGPLKSHILYERMFHFYDTDRDGLISFTEFLSGLAYLRGPKRFEPLRWALEGFDHDGDGYVDRKDFLRLLLGKYAIQKLITMDIVAYSERDDLYQAMNHIHSSQPISAAFADQDIPLGERREVGGKERDSLGDSIPRPGVPTILPDDTPWLANQRRTHLSPQQLQERLSRFSEMLFASDDEGDDDANEAQAPTRNNQADGSPPQIHNSVRPLDPSVLDMPDEEDITDIPPEDQDLLYHVVTKGFHEILHRIFLGKESIAHQVKETAAERAAHREEIDNFVAERKKFEEHMCEQAAVDPLMATALRSYQATGTLQEAERPKFQPQMLPTDEATLAQAEREIAERPLEELLRETGYMVADDLDAPMGGESAAEANGPPKSDGADDTAEGQQVDWQLRAMDGEPSPRIPDPTMPQNMPNSRIRPLKSGSEHATSASTATETRSSVRELVPSKTLSRGRLQYLSGVDLEEQEIKARGGPGKLSFEELENIVDLDPTGEIKGLVTGWLDWASF